MEHNRLRKKFDWLQEKRSYEKEHIRTISYFVNLPQTRLTYHVTSRSQTRTKNVDNKPIFR